MLIRSFKGKDRMAYFIKKITVLNEPAYRVIFDFEHNGKIINLP